jgi:polyvinyl alcohol dehydrogenase (cytochrome)
VPGTREQLLGIGQKSGVYWALDPATGKVIWQTTIGPADIVTNAGIEYGAATDGRRIYAAEADTAGLPYTVGGSGPDAGKTVTGGSWAAMDPATGKILWQTPDPQGAVDAGFVSTANGIVFAGSQAATGTNMYALDAATGKILWRFASGGSVAGGAAIVDGNVYWGSGYCGTFCLGSSTPPLNNNKLYAFGLG